MLVQLCDGYALRKELPNLPISFHAFVIKLITIHIAVAYEKSSHRSLANEYKLLSRLLQFCAMSEKEG